MKNIIGNKGKFYNSSLLKLSFLLWNHRPISFLCHDCDHYSCWGCRHDSGLTAVCFVTTKSLLNSENRTITAATGLVAEVSPLHAPLSGCPYRLRCHPQQVKLPSLHGDGARAYSCIHAPAQRAAGDSWPYFLPWQRWGRPWRWRLGILVCSHTFCIKRNSGVVGGWGC